MRLVLRIFGIATLVLLALGGALYALSEWGEVVILHSHDADGAARATHLWVVDVDGSAWLRSGGRERGWFVNAAARPEVELERNGETKPYRAVVSDAPEDVVRVDALMREKYGFTDWLVLALEGSPESVPVRMEPR